MKFHRLLAITLLGGALAAANPYQTQQEDLDAVIATGKAASKQLIETLGGNLKKQLQANGPLAAAKFCTENAFGLTQSVSDELGSKVSIKRVSLKERNPANTPEADEKAVLEALQSMQENKVILPEHLVEQVDADTYKFYKPLNINKEVCLKCHGDVKNAELANYLKSMYPTDKATGYRMGDLRGAIVVTIKK
jgi:hypothetical protein